VENEEVLTMPDASVPIDPTTPIDVNFVARTPHVVAFRLWRQDVVDGPWILLGQGHTADHVPDLVTASPPFPAGGRLAFWVGIGGNPNTQYQVLVTLAQDGRILPGGTILVPGKTNEKGVAEDHGFITESVS
jgi:hypothetical protein